nr:retrovirus-related Pol polyprotein from transposon TNT 1-94 [Tanacetum cinerariifolium]
MVTKPKKLGTLERLATPKPRKPRFILRWSPTGRLFDHEGKLAASSNSESQYNCSNGDNACTSNAIEPKIKRFPNSTSLLDRNLEGVDLLKGDRSTNLYTINLYKMTSASPICLMARASSTKSWLWHQRLSYLNFDTINDLARNHLVACLPKFKYHKEHLCPSCEQGKSKRASHPPKPVPNLRQRLHLLHMDLCGPMRIASINGKRYVLVIVDDYSRYTWVHFLRSKDEAPEVIIKFLKRITVLLQKPDISFLYVFGALCYPKNDREDIGKLGAKGDIDFFIGYSADSCAYRVYNLRTKKIMETMNVSFDELFTMAFKQRSSKPGLQSMTSGHISSGLDLTYAPSTMTTQQPSEGELDLLFEAMYDDYIGGQPSATA